MIALLSGGSAPSRANPLRDQMRAGAGEGVADHVADPHGAIGYLGLQKYFENNADYYGVFLETAHPVKFLDVVEKAIKTKVNIPPQIEEILDRVPEKKPISSYRELKEYLIDNAV